MNAIANFIRHTPRAAMATYLGNHAPVFASKSKDIFQADSDHVKPLLRAVDEMDRDEYEILRHNAERINEMTDEEGQTALLSVLPDTSAINTLANAHDRATWVFNNDNGSFRRAEETRYANHNRLGRMWDGFIGPKGKTVASSDLDLEAFRSRLAVEVFGKDTKMKIEAYSRESEDEDGVVTTVDQIVVYKEGLPDSYKALEKDEIVVKIRRPVYEIVICYESGTGEIEVIAKDKEQRETVARLFSETLLGTEIDVVRLLLKKYDISSLIAPRTFPTDPEDGIESVTVVSLGLKPMDGEGKLTIDFLSRNFTSIHERSKEWFQQNDPLKSGFYLTQAKIVVKFHPTATEKRGKSLPVKITMPNRCDLKSRTEKERLIGEKYLARWSLLKEV
jgi:hypothetical protein